MTYLIFHNGEAFYTNWFDYENHYVTGMVVFYIAAGQYTTDGQNWKPIPEDHL